MQKIAQNLEHRLKKGAKLVPRKHVATFVNVDSLEKHVSKSGDVLRARFGAPFLGVPSQVSYHRHMSRVPGSESCQSAVTPILCASDLQENKSRSDVPTNSAAKRQAVSAVRLGAERPIPDSRPNFHACLRNTTPDDRRRHRDTCMHKLSIVIGSDKILRAQHIKENTALTLVFSVSHGYQRRLMLRM